MEVPCNSETKLIDRPIDLYALRKGIVSFDTLNNDGVVSEKLLDTGREMEDEMYMRGFKAGLIKRD
jgi:hypothetical protein